ncbi:MAG: ABC transporter permease, partial [Anaerolineales bacterium]
MKLSTTIRMAIRSLQRAPTRSALTTLGIVVGVAAVVTTVSIGEGASTKIQEALAKPDSRNIFLGAAPLPSRGSNIGSKLSPIDSIQPEDYYALADKVDSVSAISPKIYLPNVSVKANGRATTAALEGMDIDGFITSPRQLIKGALFNQIEVRRASNVCVISMSLAELLYTSKWRTDRSIRINGSPFKVIGVVDEVPNVNPMFRSADLHLYIPFSSLLRRVDPTASIGIVLQASSIEAVSRVQQSVNDLMEERRSGRNAN